MAFSAGSCENCGRPAHDRVETSSGRLVCQSCSDDILAGAAAVVTGGGAGEALAIRGWLRRARQWRPGRS
jgi:hypothetical protein